MSRIEGGCRGFAHLGAVKALQEHGIYPAAISGSSAGAIAGAFLANGYTSPLLCHGNQFYRWQPAHLFPRRHHRYNYTKKMLQPV